MAHRGAALDRGRSLLSTVALCDLCDALVSPLAPVDVLTGGQRWGGVCRLQLHCVMLVVSAAGTGGCAHRKAALGRSLPSTAALCDAGGFSRWHRWMCERCQ